MTDNDRDIRQVRILQTPTTQSALIKSTENIMTKAKLREELLKIKEKPETWNYDTENRHSEADTLLLKYIHDKEVTAIYESIDKWYA